MAREPFGTRLRSLRERAGLTLKQVAEKVGTDEYHVAAWERNIARPEMAMELLISVALGVSTDELLPGEPGSSRARSASPTTNSPNTFRPTTPVQL